MRGEHVHRVAAELVERGAREPKATRLRTTARASTACTSERSTSACAGSPVCEVDQSSGCMRVGGFIAARTTIGRRSRRQPRCSRPPCAARARGDLVVPLGAATAARRTVADLDSFDRLDAHEREGEARVEAVAFSAYEPKPGRRPGRDDLDDAAERVALLARSSRAHPLVGRLGADFDRPPRDVDPEHRQQRRRLSRDRDDKC